MSRFHMQSVVRLATTKGDTNTLERVLASGYAFCPTDVELAGRLGNERVFRWFRERSVTEAEMALVRKQGLNAVPWSIDCAARGAMHAPTAEIARRMLTDLQRPANGAPPLNVAKHADDAFRWNLVQCQPRAQPSLLVLPSRL